MNHMNHEQQHAYEWAINQQFQSIAARYARTLAELVQEQEQTIQEIELEYPNWREKFATLAEAIKWHTSSQNTIITHLRAKVG